VLQYIIRRLLTVPISLFVVVAVTFVILRLTGDPVQMYLDVTGTPEQEALLRQKLGLDRPLWVQFLLFLRDALSGDLGQSLQFQAPAMAIVLERLGATLQLMAVALIIALAVGVVCGLVAAVYRDRAPDFIISSVAVAGQSMPSFWLGILLVQLFALHLGWLPTSGTGSWRHLILPSITLATFIIPNLILITRTSVLEVSGELFVTTARSKGVSEKSTLVRHIFPNALNPIISFFGLQVGRLVGGSILTETIFAWPGVGRLMIGSIYQRDVPVVIAGVLIICVAIMLCNLLVDILVSIADPRIRLE
jgi:peptide/nickel transport system permease protein/glutathione transport system permease protein